MARDDFERHATPSWPAGINANDAKIDELDNQREQLWVILNSYWAYVRKYACACLRSYVVMKENKNTYIHKKKKNSSARERRK